MDHTDSRKLAQLVTVVTIAFVIGVLYLAKQVLQPLAMSVLLTFLLAPLVSRLERLRIGRIPAVLATVALACLVLVGVGWIVTDQVIELTRKLPTYQQNLSSRIQSIRGTDNPMFGKALTTVNELVAEATRSTSGELTGSVRARSAPLPVTLVEASPLPVRILRDWLGPVLSPFGTLAVILLFMVFMLIYREDLRDRLIRLTGTEQLSMATKALDEAGQRVSGYLIKLLIVNSTYGVSVALGLWIIGVPSPFLWGFLAAVLRFIPFVGPWIAATIPIALSLAAFPGWVRPVATIALFVALELVSNNIIEPWLYGQGTGVSVVGIIAAALFWTWLWGPIGLVLSMPLTVCLTVLGRYAPSLRFITVMLSDQPGLETKLRFYQRLLALDYHEATGVVDKVLKADPAPELYASVLLPVLSLAEQDRARGQLTETQRKFIHKFIRDTVDELAVLKPLEQVAGVAKGTQTLPAASQPLGVRLHKFLCLPAEDDGDEVASAMVAQCLLMQGAEAKLVNRESVEEVIGEAETSASRLTLVISAVAASGALTARDLCRRIRFISPHAELVVGLWNASGDLSHTRQRLGAAGANGVITSIEELVKLPGRTANSSPTEVC